MTGADAATLIAAAKGARDGGRLAEAIPLQRRAVALLRGGAPGGHAHALRHLADMLCEAGAHDEAAPLFEEALAYYTGSNALDAANALRGAAVNAGRRGDVAAARAHSTRARDLYAALGIEAGVAEATRRLSASD
jgi:tetratricopeptide (TPR) repeat protein